MTRSPLRLTALGLALAACGAVVVLLASEDLSGLTLIAVPLVALVVAGLVALFARAFGFLRRWGLLVGAGAYVALGAAELTASGLPSGPSTAALAGAVLSSSLWFAHDVDEAD